MAESEEQIPKWKEGLFEAKEHASKLNQEARREAAKLVQEARDYTSEKADSTRKEAVGVLALAALVLGIAGYLFIGNSVEKKINELGGKKILDEADKLKKQLDEKGKKLTELYEREMAK